MGKIKRKEGVEFSAQNKNSAVTVCVSNFFHKEGDKIV